MDDKYQLICGERRFRASLMAGKIDIPARVMDIPAEQVLQFQIVENLQRRNVSTMDEIESIVRLRDEQGMTHSEIAKAVGKALSHIEAQFRIAKAATEVHEALKNNQIIRQVALIISKLDSPNQQIEAVNALKREKVQYLVKAKDCENWINNRFGVAGKKQPVGKFTPKISAGRFASDWKYYFLRFSNEQFLEWKRIVSNRGELPVWIDAVEKVMSEAQTNCR